MGKTEIIILIITIVVSVSLLSIFLTKTLKQKSKTNTAKKEEKTEIIKEETLEDKPKENQEKKEEIKTVKSPEISIALQNELDEFKDYLKSRVTKAPSDDGIILHPYDTPKLNSAYDDFSNDFFDDNFTPSYRRPTKHENLEEQSNRIKILMHTDFFNTKF